MKNKLVMNSPITVAVREIGTGKKVKALVVNSKYAAKKAKRALLQSIDTSTQIVTME